MSPPISIQISQAIKRVRAAVERFNPIAVVGLFSGGHDSTTATWIAHESGADAVLHINTGIGVEQTREFVRETSASQNWNLKEYKATENVQSDGTADPQIYEEIVRRYGFPGQSQHSRMYSQLKAFAQSGELSELKIWFPEVARRIENLEDEVMAIFPWRWEESPPAWFQEKKQGQTFMFNYDKFWTEPLCRNCNLTAK